MPGEKPTAAENQANAEEIKDVDATVKGPRGNTYSEADDDGVDQDAPPPLPN